MVPEKYRLKNTIKYPTSLLIGGLSKLGLEIADSLLEQGGYVVIVDTYTEDNVNKLGIFPEDSLISFLDYTAIPHLDEDIRRLDYVFYFSHDAEDFSNRISTQQFLSFSNYLDATLTLASKFDAKFLLTTAIKAHQLVVSSQEIGLNYGVGMNARHTIYTEMEVQKYAESLTMEYYEKTKLDIRILRLGEIIGDGIDFTKKTAFNELILNGASSQPLKLRKDGLETEWYVHVLDAAYGIIKAQFSRNTAGQIYSLTYDTAYTNLATAYKIQEFEPNAQEIIFVDEKDNLPSLKLYKPAPNLTTLGWIAKIPFEKSIKQSLAAAKIYLLENDSSIKKGRSNLVDKLKGFLAIADSNEDVSVLDSSSGAVSRLIAERKRQEELKKQGMEYALDKMKTKRKKRAKTFREKLQDRLWEGALSLSNSFSFMKNKSPFEMAAMLVVIFVGVLIYLYLLSPAIIIGRDILIIYPEVTEAKKNFEAYNYKALTQNLTTIKFYMDDTNNIFGNFKSLANLIALGSPYDQIKQNLQSYSIYVDGLKSISYSMEPLNDYASNYKNNTILRTATESYLSTENSGSDYSQTINELNNRIPYLNDGLAKMKVAITNINSINYNLIPGFAAAEFTRINSDIKNIYESSSLLMSAQFFQELTGTNGNKTILVMLLDNSKQTPVGGDLAAFGLLTVQNGAISEVIVQSPDQVNFNMSSIDDSILKEINSRKFNYKTKADLTVSDIGNIEDYGMYSSIVQKIFTDTYGRQVDAVFAFNYTALDSLLKTMGANGAQFQVNSISFEKGDLLQNLKLTQSGNESIQTKHTISAQLLAQVLFQISNNFKQVLPQILTTLNNEITHENILAAAPDLSYSNYISQFNMDASNVYTTSSYASLGINQADLKVVSVEKYPSVNTATEITVNSDLSISYKLDVRFPSVGSSQEISLCLPSYVLNSNIKVDNIPIERITINFTDRGKCVVARVLSETELIFNWITPVVGDNINTNQYRLNLGLSKVRGTNMTSDIKIQYSNLLNLSRITPEVNVSNNTAIFTQNLQQDQVIELLFTK